LRQKNEDGPLKATIEEDSTLEHFKEEESIHTRSEYWKIKTKSNGAGVWRLVAEVIISLKMTKSKETKNSYLCTFNFFKGSKQG